MTTTVSGSKVTTDEIDLVNPVSISDGGTGSITSQTTQQVVHFQDGAVATGTTTVPDDNTIPQITEGDEYMTLAITPKSATNKLRIQVNFKHSYNILNVCVASLFVGSTADALATGSDLSGAEYRAEITLDHIMTAGVITPLTFRVRAGGIVAGTVTMNGQGGVAKFGGVYASTITITEYTP